MARERLDDTGEHAVLPLVEEALRVGKRRAETGRVRVSVSTATEERLLRETLRTEREEIRLRLVAAEEAVEQPVTLRRQRSVVERLPPSSAAGGPDADGGPLPPGRPTT